MAAPYTLSPDFSQHVDALLHDASLSDSVLHVRAQRYLAVFEPDQMNSNSAGSVSVRVENQVVHASPSWAQRIGQVCHALPGRRDPFTTPGLFDAMYQMADELDLVAGRRYVSASICVCGERATAHNAGDAYGDGEPRARSAQALHQLSSTWVAFLLWPFYAGAQEYTSDSWMEDYEDGDVTPTAEAVAKSERAKALRRRCGELVRERDGYRCFMNGVYDSKWYHRRVFPADARFLNCDTVPIVPTQLWAHEDPGVQDAILDMLARFGGVPSGGPALAEKAAPHAPRNTLFVYVAATDAFVGLLWSLNPTETPDCYEIKSCQPAWDAGCRHIASHVTFVDHSAPVRRPPTSSLASLTSHSLFASDPDPDANAEADCDPRPTSPVDLPDRDLLRAHAALAGVLHRSGARRAFLLRLRYACREVGAPRPGASGGAFWRSMVGYAGPEVCAEVEAALRESEVDFV